MRPILLALLCLAACGAPRSQKKQETPFRTHALYEGRRRPAGEVAVILVLTPSGRAGTGTVRKIRDEKTGVEYEPKLGWSLIEMLPGRYVVHAGFWTQRTSLTTDRAGKQALKMEDLIAAELVPMHITVEAGKTYYIDPELRKKADLAPAEIEQFHPLQYGKEVARTAAAPPSRHGISARHVWRPRLATLPPKQAARYGR